MKIAVLLPLKPDLSWLRRARALGIALTDDVARRRLGDVQVAVGLPAGDNDTWQARSRMIGAGLADVVVRALSWEAVSARQASRMFPALSVAEDLDRVAVPKDWGWNFADCDAWIVLGDAAVGAFAHLKPTAVHCRDLAARYVPEGYAPDMRDPLWDRQVEAFRAWRHAECVFATDPATLDDVVGYAGVKRSRTRLLPPLWALYDAPLGAARTEFGDAVVWLTEPSPGHDAATVIEALRRHVRRGGATRLVIAGEQVWALDPRRGEPGPVTLALARAPELLARTSFETLASPGQFDAVVAGAGLVWSSVVAEGEPDVVPIAARHARPLVACDYPQMRRAGEMLGATARLYTPGDVEGACAALIEAQSATGAAPAEDRLPPGTAREEVIAAYSDLVETLASRART